MKDVGPDLGKDESEKNNSSLTVQAKTVAEAVDQGLRQLNLSKEQVQVEIIKEGSRGILGFGAEDAVVILTPHQPDSSLASPEEKPLRNAGATRAQIISETLMAEGEQTEAQTGDQDQLHSVPDVELDTYSRAKEILEALLEKMSVTADVTVREGHDLVEAGEEVPLTLDITGPDLGILIGRRGETLHALQYVVRQILSKEVGQWIPVLVDVESYLVRRRKSLMQLAKRMSERAVLSKRKVTLEPMSAQDRRIIHLQLRESDDVYTQSVGEGDRRKVVIYPKQ
jgi:spoIIIJ-associated protein